MSLEKIIVQASIQATKNKVWDYYTNPIHITQWNFADPSWHCPSAENDMQIGGKYLARMEAKDGSFGFDFEAIYSVIHDKESFTYGFTDREVNVQFKEQGEFTEVIITFDPEHENPIELQQQGWQAILNNFKTYVETN